MKMKNKCIICVDGGGTKTEVVAYTKTGEVLSHHRGGSGNLSLDVDIARNNITHLIKDVYDEIRDIYQCELIQMGISGYGAYVEKEKFINQIKYRFNTNVDIVDDAKLALYTILKDDYQEGILVLAGTGSACYGYGYGKTVLVGGWGYLLGDEGSSYELVIRAFKSMIHDENLGLSHSELTIKLLNHLKLKHVMQLKQYVYQNTKAEIAQQAKFINEWAQLGEIQAIKLLKQSGISLAQQAIIVYQRMKLANDVRVGCQGSFLLNSEIVNRTFKEEIKKLIPRVCIIESLDPPVKGAYYLAKRKLTKKDGDN